MDISIKLFCLITIFTIFIMFFFIFAGLLIAANPAPMARLRLLFAQLRNSSFQSSNNRSWTNKSSVGLLKQKKLYFNYFEILDFYLLLEKFVINSLFKWNLVLKQFYYSIKNNKNKKRLHSIKNKAFF